MVRSKESTGDVGIVVVVVLLLLLRGPSRVFDDDDDDISGVNVSRTKGVSSPSSKSSLITFDFDVFFVGIGLDLFVAETTVAIKIAFASKHFSAAWWWWWFCRGVGVIDTLDKSGLAGKTISLSLCAFPPTSPPPQKPRTNPNGFFGATSSM